MVKPSTREQLIEKLAQYHTDQAGIGDLKECYFERQASFYDVCSTAEIEQEYAEILENTMSKSQIVITLDPAVWGRAPEHVRAAFYTIWEDGPEDCGTHLRFYHPGLQWNMLDLPGSHVIRDWVFALDKEDCGYLELGPKYADVYAFGSIHEQGYRLRSTILFPDGTEMPKEAA